MPEVDNEGYLHLAMIIVNYISVMVECYRTVHTFLQLILALNGFDFVLFLRRYKWSALCMLQFFAVFDNAMPKIVKWKLHNIYKFHHYVTMQYPCL
jgi:hypothetical protein